MAQAEGALHFGLQPCCAVGLAEADRAHGRARTVVAKKRLDRGDAPGPVLPRSIG
jgi:hypothetical protein